jgi:membrane protein required for colicin V production
MNGADYLILAVLAISTVIGILRGFLKEAVSLIAWLGGLWVAWRFSYLVEPHLGGLLADEPVNTWAARVIVLMLVVLVGWAVGALLTHLVHRSGLSLMMDRLLGLCFGVVRGVVLVAIAVIFAQLLEFDAEPWWGQSKLLPYASDVSRWVRAYAEAGADYLDQQLDDASSAAKAET